MHCWVTHQRVVSSLSSQSQSENLSTFLSRGHSGRTCVEPPSLWAAIRVLALGHGARAREPWGAARRPSTGNGATGPRHAGRVCYSAPVACNALHPAHRLYLCARCRRQVSICTRCDRGNRYCSPNCATAARRDSLRYAGRRYQMTDTGRIKHNARQQSYRQRRAAADGREPGCDPGVRVAPIPRIPKESALGELSGKVTTAARPHQDRVIVSLNKMDEQVEMYCSPCGKRCSPFSRRYSIRDILRTRRARRLEQKRHRTSGG